jgi:hypothetical protein
MNFTPNSATEIHPPEPPAVTDDIVVRPSHLRDGNEPLTFFWSPGIYLAEMIRIPRRGLRFVVRHGRSPVRIEESAAGHPPLKWIEDYARNGALRLPSGIAAYGTLDELAGQVRDFVHRYFDCDAQFESVVTLYALHSWIYERFHAVPYLRFLGPAASGKTRATEVIGALCYHPLVIAGSITPAPMFRMIEAAGGTVLIDEADFRDSDVGSEIVKVLNCGYQKGLPVTRLDKVEGGQYVPQQYQVFGPKIINGRRRFQDDATETRCLSFTPVATDRNDLPVQLPERFQHEAGELQNRLLQWRFDTLESATPSDEHVTAISRRTNQIILPLLTVANLMGNDQRARYRDDLLEFASQIDSQSLAVRAESEEAAVVRAILYCPSSTEPPTCQDLCGIAVMDDDESMAAHLKSYLRPRRVGEIARELGFKTRHTRNGTVVVPDPARLRSLAARFGVVMPRRPEPPSRA